jgi:anti-sigma factor RsiW
MTMSGMDDKLELLMGEFLDGEIAPEQERVLEEELQRNSDARERLEQLRTLRECSRHAIRSEIVSAADAEGIFERAWQRSRKPSWRRIVRADGHLRFAVGLAAGFVLGLSLHFVLIRQSQLPGDAAGPARPARTIARHEVEPAPAPPLKRYDASHRVTREVDWFVVTDGAGNRWLIEGVREGKARPAAYYGSL